MKKMFSFMLLSILALLITSNTFSVSANASKDEFSLIDDNDNDFFSMPKSPKLPAKSIKDLPNVHFYGGTDDEDYDLSNISDEELKKQIGEAVGGKDFETQAADSAKKPSALLKNIKDLKAPNMRKTRQNILLGTKSLTDKEITFYENVSKEGNAEQKRWAKQIIFHDERLKKKKHNK